uniref:Uncharacterized protein n=1 Tax=Branchiostoma floridae TaxID=7739 RepID=C3Y7U0_BRAFL|eukprot:XP_002607585.1 hypothetical protein BRAFLDRAFT_71463 [Branchiostoma floridae]
MSTCSATQQCSLLHSRVGALPDSASMRLHAYILGYTIVQSTTFPSRRLARLGFHAAPCLHAPQCSLTTFPSRPLAVLGVTAIPSLHTYQCNLQHSRVGALPDSASMRLHVYMLRSVASLPSRVGRWPFSVLLRSQACILTSATYNIPESAPSQTRLPCGSMSTCSAVLPHYLPESAAGRSRCYCGPKPAYLPVQPTTFPSRRLARLAFHVAPCLHAPQCSVAAFPSLPLDVLGVTAVPSLHTYQCSLLYSRVGALPDSASMWLHAYMLWKMLPCYLPESAAGRSQCTTAAAGRSNRLRSPATLQGSPVLLPLRCQLVTPVLDRHTYQHFTISKLLATRGPSHGGGV